MKTIKLTLALASITLLAGCLAVTGTIGFTDPKTGVNAGIAIGNAKPGKNVVKSKAGASLKFFRNDHGRINVR